MELQGKAVLITGASRGLGAAIAMALAPRGCRLGLVSRNGELLERVVREIEGVGGWGFAFPCDVTKEDQVFNMAVSVERECGEVELLINSAGLGRYNPLELLTPGEIHEMIDTNLKGTIFVTQAIYQRMRRRARGWIVNILSTAGREGKARETAYCASKWGVMGFSKALALEAKNYNIRVTAFCPGGMNTPFWDHETADSKPQVDRFLSAETVAQAILGMMDLPENVDIPEYALRAQR
jgi:short-subunit dehydrogenase